MYQNTSSLLLSQSQGWNLIRLAATNTRLEGAINSRARPRSASGLSKATKSSGQKRPGFLITHTGEHERHAEEPEPRRPREEQRPAAGHDAEHHQAVHMEERQEAGESAGDQESHLLALQRPAP